MARGSDIPFFQVNLLPNSPPLLHQFIHRVHDTIPSLNQPSSSIGPRFSIFAPGNPCVPKRPPLPSENPASVDHMQRPSSALQFSNLLNPSSQLDSEVAEGMDVMATGGRIPPLLNGIPDDGRQDLPRPYKCPRCEKAFHRLEHQTRHIRTHTGEKPHGCSFPGCLKRFSRSDELTRHSRIHNNPNSRRNNKSHNVAALTAYPHAHVLAHVHSHESTPSMMMPPPQTMTQSAPPSTVGSPDASPPNSYTPGANNIHPMLGPHGRSRGGSPGAHLPPPFDINMLATAASQVERDDRRSQQSVYRHHPPRPHHPHPYYGLSSGRFPSRAHPSYLHPAAPSMARSPSHDEEDPTIPRISRRSGPNSPLSTAPSSPTFSYGSFSPTPDHTPLATPAHSPRLRPHGCHDLHLPGIRHLSLQHPSSLAPMEPHGDGSLLYGGPSNPWSNYPPRRVIDPLDTSHRKLPLPQVPKVAVQYLLNPGGGFSSGSSSAAGSMAGGDLAERY